MTLPSKTIGTCCAIFRECDVEPSRGTDIITLVVTIFSFVFVFFLVAGLLFG